MERSLGLVELGIQHMHTEGQTTTQADLGTCFASNCEESSTNDRKCSIGF